MFPVSVTVFIVSLVLALIGAPFFIVVLLGTGRMRDVLKGTGASEAIKGTCKSLLNKTEKAQQPSQCGQQQQSPLLKI